jgi:hypothetical protein
LNLSIKKIGADTIFIEQALLKQENFWDIEKSHPGPNKNPTLSVISSALASVCNWDGGPLLPLSGIIGIVLA